MSKNSTSRVQKHRLMNRVFGRQNETEHIAQVSEDSSEEELLAQERLPQNNSAETNDGPTNGINYDPHGWRNDDGPVGHLNEAILDSDEEHQMSHHDEHSSQSDTDGSWEGNEVESSFNEQQDDDPDPSDPSDSRSEEGSESSAESLEEYPEIIALRKWALESRIPAKHLDSLLCILRERLLPQLPKTAKTFLGLTKAVYQVESMTDSKDCEGEFAYLGVEEALKACININLHPDRRIPLDCSVDGLKIHKSSPKGMWALFCKVYYDPDVYKPFPVAVFYGKGKPKSFHDFFEKFIIEINHLLENGVIIDGERFIVEIRRFICDTQARDAVKNTQGHTSAHGCGRCKVVGRKVNGVLVFLDLDCEKRTSEGFKNFEDVDYHNGPSALLALNTDFDFIYQFILDIMHLIYLGVVARMLTFTMNGAPNSPVERLSAEQKTELDRRSLMIKKDIPYEFKRKMPSTNLHEDYHAVDYRFFLKYCCPVLFKKLLQKKYYDNWVRLHIADRQLSGPRAVQEVGQARGHLRQFVEDSIVLYGEVFCTINVHGLDHIADDVEKAGCSADKMTAFPYENDYGKLKNILLSPHRTIAQYCRKVHIQRTTGQVPELPEDLSIMKNTIRQGITEVKYHGYFFSTKHPNNTALLRNGRVVQIHKFSQINDDIFLEVTHLRIKKSIYTFPQDSALMNSHELLEQVENPEKSIINIDQISGKYFKMSLNFAENEIERTFVIPLNHAMPN